MNYFSNVSRKISFFSKNDKSLKKVIEEKRKGKEGIFSSLPICQHPICFLKLN
jgi:peroxiredoxin